jgi:hypothetical protein
MSPLTDFTGLNKVQGSLVLGGYDESKASQNLSLAFGPDISRDLTVGLQAITASTTKESNVSLLPGGIFAFIDSTVPHLWLPLEACQKFEEAFGLTWNSDSELYLVNDALHQELVTMNASLAFRIGNLTTGGPTIEIVLPYASFDLEVDFPIVSNRTRYFPLKRATNETQYTLGRTFLQEA